MTSQSDIAELVGEHLEEFMNWMATNWQMDERDGREVTNLPTSPDAAFMDGWNRACQSVASAYELFTEEHSEQ